MTSKIKSVFTRLNRRDLPLLPKLKINKYFKISLVILLIISTVFTAKTIMAEDESTTSTSNIINIDTTTEIDYESKSSSTTQAVSDFKDKQSARDDSNSQESWMNESASSNVLVGIGAIAGTIPDEVLDGLDIGTTGNTSWVPSGLIGFGNKTIAMTYNIPVSGQQYIAYVRDNLFGKSAYAADSISSGYQGLLPIMNIWKGFRNATYIIFSIIFVVIGILIMLRVKISPQTVINVQNAIPKLITSLILVTFSYAIVGLLIDFTYVIEGLGLSIINSAAGDDSIKQTAIETLTHPHLLNRLFALIPAGVLAIWSAIISFIIGLVFALATAGAGALVGVLSLGVIVLTILIFIVVQVFKFLFGLLKCYVNIILRTVLAPLEIALGAIPNMKMGFGSWFLNIFANLMVFPISMVVLVLIKTLMNAIAGSTYSMWSPLGTGTLNILTASYASGGIVAVALGLGGLMLVAKLPKLIPEVIFQIKPSAFGKAMGETVAVLPGVKLAQTGLNLGREAVFKRGGEWLGTNSKEGVKETVKNRINQIKNGPPTN